MPFDLDNIHLPACYGPRCHLNLFLSKCTTQVIFYTVPCLWELKLKLSSKSKSESGDSCRDERIIFIWSRGEKGERVFICILFQLWVDLKVKLEVNTATIPQSGPTINKLSSSPHHWQDHWAGEGIYEYPSTQRIFTDDWRQQHRFCARRQTDAKYWSPTDAHFW